MENQYEDDKATVTDFNSDLEEQQNQQIESEKNTETEEDDQLIPSHDLRGIVYQDLKAFLMDLHAFVEARLNEIRKNANHTHQSEKVQALVSLKVDIINKLNAKSVRVSDANEVLMATEKAMKIDRDNYQKYGKFINRLIKILGINRTPNSLKIFHTTYGFRQESVMRIETIKSISNQELQENFKEKGKVITDINLVGQKTKGNKITISSLRQNVGSCTTFKKGNILEVTYQSINHRKSFTKR